MILTLRRATTALTLPHLGSDTAILVYLGLADTVVSWHLYILSNPNPKLAKPTARLTSMLPVLGAHVPSTLGGHQRIVFPCSRRIPGRLLTHEGRNYIESSDQTLIPGVLPRTMERSPSARCQIPARHLSCDLTRPDAPTTWHERDYQSVFYKLHYRRQPLQPLPELSKARKSLAL